MPDEQDNDRDNDGISDNDLDGDGITNDRDVDDDNDGKNDDVDEDDDNDGIRDEDDSDDDNDGIEEQRTMMVERANAQGISLPDRSTSGGKGMSHRRGLVEAWAAEWVVVDSDPSQSQLKRGLCL